MILTAERLRALLAYDLETGWFTWRVDRTGRARASTRAGRPNAEGHRQVSVDGVRYMEHRLAWLYVYGKWPADQIDHINGIRDDNRIQNLREATNAENMQNQRRARSDNKIGMLGVCLHRGSWAATIRVDGRKKHLGYYGTAEAAHAAYVTAKRELHPFSTI